MKKRFKEEQIVKILREAEAGMWGRDFCWEHYISEQTFYRWQSKDAGMDISEVKRLRHLSDDYRVWTDVELLCGI